jgi:8-oxo-dGTP pyrophosphatase MutT (NUDIX family)
VAQEDVFYLGIKVLMINRQGQVLLLLRCFASADEGRLWDIPGGRKRRGEDIADALEREVFEETGLQIDGKAVQFVGSTLTISRIPLGETDAGLILFVYKCNWDDPLEVRLSREHSESWWATPEEAREVLRPHIPPGFLNCCIERG